MVAVGARLGLLLLLFFFIFVFSFLSFHLFEARDKALKEKICNDFSFFFYKYLSIKKPWVHVPPLVFHTILSNFISSFFFEILVAHFTLSTSTNNYIKKVECYEKGSKF